MGKSASGKDTIYRRLIGEKEFDFRTLVPYTTRPMRSGEENGKDYFFTDEAGLLKLQQEKKVIELRTYQTVLGPWHYFTVDDGQVDLAQYDYLMVGTLESYRALRDYYSAEKVVPIYVAVDDGLRLQRALDRERAQDEPKGRWIWHNMIISWSGRWNPTARCGIIIPQKRLCRSMWRWTTG